jgi:ATP synthase protein I
MNKSPQDQDNSPPDDQFTEGKQDLAEMGRKLAQANAEHVAPSKLAAKIKQPPSNAMGLAMRVSVEVLSAVAVGLAIGWVLDDWLGTRPWLMLVFLLIGGAAGILNVYRMALTLGTGVQNETTKGDSGNKPE